MQRSVLHIITSDIDGERKDGIFNQFQKVSWGGFEVEVALIIIANELSKFCGRLLGGCSLAADCRL